MGGTSHGGVRARALRCSLIISYSFRAGYDALFLSCAPLLVLSSPPRRWGDPAAPQSQMSARRMPSAAQAGSRPRLGPLLLTRQGAFTVSLVQGHRLCTLPATTAEQCRHRHALAGSRQRSRCACDGKCFLYVTARAYDDRHWSRLVPL
jgi:hypothetical protein